MHIIITDLNMLVDGRPGAIKISRRMRNMGVPIIVITEFMEMDKKMAKDLGASTI